MARVSLAAATGNGSNNQAGSQSLRLINAHVDPHAAVGGQLEQLEVLVDHAKQFQVPV